MEDTNTVEIPLTQGVVAIVDTDLADIVNCHKWKSRTGYALHIYQVSMHRLIWEHVNGPIPPGMVIDHINGNRADNRLANLRMVPRRQNSWNQKGHRTGTYTSQYVGVSFDKSEGKWAAQIWIKGKVKHLGRFKTEIEASNAYQSALAKLENH